MLWYKSDAIRYTFRFFSLAIQKSSKPSALYQMEQQQHQPSIQLLSDQAVLNQAVKKRKIRDVNWEKNVDLKQEMESKVEPFFNTFLTSELLEVTKAIPGTPTVINYIGNLFRRDFDKKLRLYHRIDQIHSAFNINEILPSCKLSKKSTNKDIQDHLKEASFKLQNLSLKELEADYKRLCNEQESTHKQLILWALQSLENTNPKLQEALTVFQKALEKGMSRVFKAKSRIQEHKRIEEKIRKSERIPMTDETVEGVSTVIRNFIHKSVQSEMAKVSSKSGNNQQQQQKSKSNQQQRTQPTRGRGRVRGRGRGRGRDGNATRSRIVRQ